MNVLCEKCGLPLIAHECPAASVGCASAPGSAPMPFEDTPATIRVLRIPQGDMAALGRFSQIEQALIDQGWRMIENMRHDGGYWRSTFVRPHDR